MQTKKPVNYRLDIELLDRVKNALASIPPGKIPGRETITDLIELGLTEQVTKLEAEFNKGRPFKTT